MNILGIENVNETLSTHYTIYKITNNINGKYYIGQHKTNDIYDDYMGSGQLIINAEIKYNLSSFLKEILFDFDNFDDMNNKEKELVQLSNCWPYDKMSYNLLVGGYAGNRSEISNKKISDKHKLLWKNKSKTELLKWSNDRRKSMLSDSNAMRGHKVLDFMTNAEINKWKNNIAKSNKERVKNPNWLKRMSDVTKGENNPMYGHSCTEYMSEDKIRQWKNNISKATKGKNNPMYGKNSWEKCSDEERTKRIEKFKSSMKGKNKGKRCMKLPNETHWKYIKQEDIQKYLDLGYLFYSLNKGKLFK